MIKSLPQYEPWARLLVKMMWKLNASGFESRTRHALINQKGRLNMTTENTMLTKQEKSKALAGSLDALSLQIQEAWMTEGTFTRTIAYGMAVAEMREALTPGVMQAIMKLKGSKLGFRTDESMQNNYSVELVRDAVIDAATLGLQCVGNQFNIIGGNMYVTKEGFTYLLRKLSAEGKLKDMKFIYHPAEISESSTQGTRKDGSMYQKIEREGRVKVDVSCTWKGKPVREQLEFIVRVNNGMSQDAILGKAERKAKAWLYNFLTDQSIGDGEAEENAAVAEMRDVTPRKVAAGLTVSKPAVEEAAAMPEPVVEEVGSMFGSDALPGLEVAVGEQDEAALQMLTGRLAKAKRRMGDVVMYCRRNGVACPEMGAPRAELARFAGWLMRQDGLMTELENEFEAELRD